MNERIWNSLLHGLRAFSDTALAHMGGKVAEPVTVADKAPPSASSTLRKFSAEVLKAAEEPAPPPPSKEAAPPAAESDPPPVADPDPPTEEADPAADPDPPPTAATAGDHLSSEQIAELKRPEMIRYIEERPAILASSTFQEQLGGTLHRKQAKTIKSALVDYMRANPGGAPSAVPAPPTEIPKTTVPSVETPPQPSTVEDPPSNGKTSSGGLSLSIVDDDDDQPSNDPSYGGWDWAAGDAPVIPVEAMHPEVQENEDLRDEATQLMGFFPQVQASKGPDALRGFFGKKGCNGICVMHDKDQIHKCVKSLGGTPTS